MKQHATIRLGDYNIPLIGIAAEATTEKCDLCRAPIHIQGVRLTGVQFICFRCVEDKHTVKCLKCDRLFDIRKPHYCHEETKPKAST